MDLNHRLAHRLTSDIPVVFKMSIPYAVIYSDSAGGQREQELFANQLQGFVVTCLQATMKSVSIKLGLSQPLLFC